MSNLILFPKLPIFSKQTLPLRLLDSTTYILDACFGQIVLLVTIILNTLAEQNKLQGPLVGISCLSPVSSFYVGHDIVPIIVSRTVLFYREV